MLDWSLASTISKGVAKLAPSGDPAPFQAVAGPNAESERLVSEYTGLQPITPLPAPEAVGREEWIDANLKSMRGVLEPVVDKLGGGSGVLGGVVGTAAGGLLAIEAGAISGFLAGRVLGQYEFPVLDAEAPSRLLFVAPNLGHVATQLEADHDQLLRWVSLHETTHALQFGGVPWLRGHIAESVGSLLDELSVDTKGLLRMPDTSDLRAMVDNVRDGGVASVVLNEEQRAKFDALQALMAVLEGYAEHVMDAVGADVLEDLPALRSSLDRRRRERSGFMRLLERLIGMDLKLRQYELGKRFCDGVAARGGIETLNRVWISPESMPTLAELEDPAAWIARTDPAGLDRAA